MQKHISSAAGGKKAAPKAPARRRPAPVAAPPPPSEQTTPTPVSVPPPSPPPTQQDAETEPPSQKEPTPAPSQPEKPVEPIVEKAQSESSGPTPIVVEPTSRPIVQTAPTPPPTQVVAPQPVVPPTPEPTQAPQPSTSQIEVSSSRQDAPIPPPQPLEPGPTATLGAFQEQQVRESPIAGPSTNTEQIAQAAQPTPPTTGPAPNGKNKRARVDAPTAAPRTAKRMKRSSARSNATVQANIEQDTQPQPTATFTPANAEFSENNAELGDTTAPKKTTRKKAAKPRKSNFQAKSAETIVNSDDEGETIQTQEVSNEGTEETPAPAPKPKAPRKPRKPRKRAAASATPAATDGNQEQPHQMDIDQPQTDEAQEDEEDPENHEIDPKTLSMYDLSYDRYHGKTSDIGRKMAEIDWEEVGHRRRAAANLIAMGGQNEENGVVQSVEGTDNATPGQNVSNAQSPAPAPNQDTIGFRLDHNGEIVADEVTLEVARGEAERDQAVNAPVEEINDLTVHLNRTTWINNNRRDPMDRVPAWKWKSDPWSEEETDKFYEALASFGTDFFIISKMFPPKTRRMIKAKFVREEKLDPQRVNDALCGKITKPMSLDFYCAETGKDESVFTKYEGIEHAQSVINASMKDRQDELAMSLEQEATLAAERDEEKKKQKKKEKESSKKSKKKAPKGGTMGGGGGGPEEPAEEVMVV